MESVWLVVLTPYRHFRDMDSQEMPSNVVLVVTIGILNPFCGKNHKDTRRGQVDGCFFAFILLFG